MAETQSALPLPGPLLLVGCGNMAGAMLRGWLDAGADPSQITVVRPSGAPVAEGVRVLTALPEDEVPALVLLGIKPQKLAEVAAGLARLLDPATILVSILAGVELATLHAHFPRPRAIVRAMPNTPVSLRKGVVDLHSDTGDEAARGRVDRLMAALGHAEWFVDEAAFALAGHLTGAAPAFFYRFLDALAGAAAELGLPPDLPPAWPKAPRRWRPARTPALPSSPAASPARAARPRRAFGCSTGKAGSPPSSFARSTPRAGVALRWRPPPAHRLINAR
jgi:pyrroline-5-carboxylate reductase